MEKARQLRENRIFMEESQHPFKPEVNKKSAAILRSKNLDSLDEQVLTTDKVIGKVLQPKVLNEPGSDLYPVSEVGDLKIDGVGRFKSKFMQNHSQAVDQEDIYADSSPRIPPPRSRVLSQAPPSRVIPPRVLTEWNNGDDTRSNQSNFNAQIASNLASPERGYDNNKDMKLISRRRREDVDKVGFGAISDMERNVNGGNSNNTSKPVTSRLSLLKSKMKERRTDGARERSGADATDSTLSDNLRSRSALLPTTDANGVIDNSSNAGGLSGAVPRSAPQNHLGIAGGGNVAPTGNRYPNNNINNSNFNYPSGGESHGTVGEVNHGRANRPPRRSVVKDSSVNWPKSYDDQEEQYSELDDGRGGARQPPTNFNSLTNNVNNSNKNYGNKSSYTSNQNRNNGYTSEAPQSQGVSSSALTAAAAGMPRRANQFTNAANMGSGGSSVEEMPGSAGGGGLDDVGFGMMSECPDCGRKFNELAYAKHVKICKDVFIKKRKAFDMAQKRVEGNPELLQILKKREKEEKMQAMKAAKANHATAMAAISHENRAVGGGNGGDGGKPIWKAQSEAFREALRAARKAQKAQAEGKPLPPVLPSAPDPSLVQCPHCSRRFNANAAERHIPHCKNMKARPSTLKRGAGGGGGVNGGGGVVGGLRAKR